MRRKDWERRLASYLAGCQGVAFAYGKNPDLHFATDCALFAAGAVRAMTGNDPARGFRGKYRSVATSVRALREIGAGSLEATIDSMFEVIPTALAGRGDLVFRDGSVGVCVGGEALFVGEEDGLAGLVRFPRREWSKAWRV